MLFCFFIFILSLNVKMYLWLKLYTVPLFVSEQTYKISKGSNNYCSCKYSAKWQLVEVEEKPTHCIVILYALPIFLYFIIVKIKFSFEFWEHTFCFMFSNTKRKFLNEYKTPKNWVWYIYSACGRVTRFFCVEEINTAIFLCNCNSPVVGEEVQDVLLLSHLTCVPQSAACRQECSLNFNQVQWYVFIFQF